MSSFFGKMNEFFYNNKKRKKDNDELIDKWLERENILFSEEMKKRRKVFKNTKKEFCPHCYSQKLKKIYSHFFNGNKHNIDINEENEKEKIDELKIDMSDEKDLYKNTGFYDNQERNKDLINQNIIKKINYDDLNNNINEQNAFKNKNIKNENENEIGGKLNNNYYNINENKIYENNNINNEENENEELKTKNNLKILKISKLNVDSSSEISSNDDDYNDYNNSFNNKNNYYSNNKIEEIFQRVNNPQIIESFSPLNTQSQIYQSNYFNRDKFDTGNFKNSPFSFKEQIHDEETIKNFTIESEKKAKSILKVSKCYAPNDKLSIIFNKVKNAYKLTKSINDNENDY